MIDHTIDLIAACHEENDPDQRATMALIFADWLEDQGHSFDAGTVRLAVESGMDGFDAVLSVPSGGSGRTTGDLKVIRVKDHDLRFRWCPAGSFQMGKPLYEDGRYANDGWVTTRLTRGFWMQEVPMTQDAWVACEGFSIDWSFFGVGGSLPATGISHGEAMEFAALLTARLRESGELPLGWRFTLPTEAQWEYACRAGKNTRFSWGDDEDQLNTYAWHSNNSRKNPHDVSTRQPNEWGLHDMLGNVFEWCLDGWTDQIPGGDDPFFDPLRSLGRVGRGGAWFSEPVYCYPEYRSWFSSDSRFYYVGTRLAMIRDAGTSS